MTSAPKQNNPVVGVGFILIGIVAISVNDMMIKFLSGGYPLHQMVFTRSAIGIVFSLIIVQFGGGCSILKTNRSSLHAVRGLMIVAANMTLFAALPGSAVGRRDSLIFRGTVDNRLVERAGFGR